MAELVVHCRRCGGCDERRLYARMGMAWWLCAACWRAAGQPRPDPPTLQEVHRGELAAHERMTARGGEDRYRVRAGKA